jgi:hypothetical protein
MHIKTHRKQTNRKGNRTNGMSSFNGMSTLILPSVKDEYTRRVRNERLNKKCRHVLGLIDSLKQLVLLNN